METSKRCFVVMGFGIKTDLATGRKLNLDKSYQALIKPVVEESGYECIRADEIKHSGYIEIPMYNALLSADLVIADLSTANVNAFYELGIRHALKPRTTILMCEELYTFPFDINHISINKYKHMGESIDLTEINRFTDELKKTIKKVQDTEDFDSPVYTFLSLTPPALIQVTNAVNAIPSPEIKKETTLSYMIAEAEQALKSKDFSTAKRYFQIALDISNKKSDLEKDEKSIPTNDPYLIQRLALCTYKSGDGNYIELLNEALDWLEKIDLGRTNDPETVELAGSIEKHLYEEGQGDEHLNNAIIMYQRGYFLLHSRHNGINLAYLLTLRASTNLDRTRDEKIADIVWANRIRQDVLQMCKMDSEKIAAMKSQFDLTTNAVNQEQEVLVNEQRFWIAVNKAEANFGVGNLEEYVEATAEASTMKYEGWMMDAFTKQRDNLEILLAKLKAMDLPVFSPFNPATDN